MHQRARRPAAAACRRCCRRSRRTRGAASAPGTTTFRMCTCSGRICSAKATREGGDGVEGERTADQCRHEDSRVGERRERVRDRRPRRCSRSPASVAGQQHACKLQIGARLRSASVAGAESRPGDRARAGDELAADIGQAEVDGRHAPAAPRRGCAARPSAGSASVPVEPRGEAAAFDRDVSMRASGPMVQPSQLHSLAQPADARRPARGRRSRANECAACNASTANRQHRREPSVRTRGAWRSRQRARRSASRSEARRDRAVFASAERWCPDSALGVDRAPAICDARSAHRRTRDLAGGRSADCATARSLAVASGAAGPRRSRMPAAARCIGAGDEAFADPQR